MFCSCYWNILANSFFKILVNNLYCSQTLGYDIKMYPIVRLQFRTSDENEATTSLPLLQIHSSVEVVVSVRVSFMGQRDLFENNYLKLFVSDRNTWYQITVSKLFVLDWNTWHYKTVSKYLYWIWILDTIKLQANYFLLDRNTWYHKTMSKLFVSDRSTWNYKTVSELFVSSKNT